MATVLLTLLSIGARPGADALVAAGGAPTRSDPGQVESPSRPTRVPVADGDADEAGEVTAEEPDAPQEAAAEEQPESTIAGRVLLMDGTPLPNHTVTARSPHPSIQPGGRAPSFAAKAAQDGSFELALPRPGSWLLEAWGADEIPGALREDVEAPATGVELRLDALLVSLRVDAAAVEDPQQALPISVRPFGGEPAAFAMRLFHRKISPDEPVRLLLATGPGYLFEVDRGSGRSLVGRVDPDLPSGPIDVWLQESDPALGTVHVVLSGMELTPPNRVGVWLHTTEGSFASVSVAAPQREAWSGSLPPGRYAASPRVGGTPPFDWARAASAVDSIEVVAGEVSMLEVELLPAGMVTVAVSLPEDVPRDERPSVLLEVLDPRTDEWRSLAMHRSLLGGGRETGLRLVPGRTYRSDELFPPGELALRASAEGWRPVEGTVVIQAGRESAWTPALEPE